MPSNVPNISRDSFDFTKFYDAVVLQQGVPIPDSDWNEMNDVLRMSRVLDTAYVLGTMRIDSGFEHTGVVPAIGGPTDNNFELQAGHALVDGVLTPTTNADPPAALEYESTALGANDNYIVHGTVTSTGAGAITCDELNLASFHDLLANAFHGDARVRMLTGAEAGNDFDVSAYTATTITLSGGTATIAATDTFKVIPPALTTPGGARNDHAYLMVWWEDIAYEEDNNIQHPSLGVETAHRAQRRWCVRVIENGTSVNIPTSSAIGTFAVRYLYLFSLTRSANPEAYPPNAVPVAQSFGTSLKALYDKLAEDTGTGFIGTDRSNYWNGVAPAAIGGAGLLNSAGLTTLEAALLNIEEGVQRRRAFTAVLTDGTVSTGGDWNATDAIDKIADGTFDSGGTFFARRGTHEFGVGVTGIPATQMPNVAGEIGRGSSGSQRTEIRLSAAHAAYFDLHGRYENVKLSNANATYMFRGSDQKPLTLRNVVAGTGALQLRGTMIDWRGGEIVAEAGPSTVGLDLQRNSGGSTEAVTGIIEDVIIRGNGGTACYCNVNESTPDTVGTLTFRNCTFEGGAGHALDIQSTDVTRHVFEGCAFRNDSAFNETLQVFSAHRVTFRDCYFYNEQGRAAKIHNADGCLFENCTFEGGDGTAIVDGLQVLVVTGSSLFREPVVFRDCTITIGASVAEGTPGYPAVEFGGDFGTRDVAPWIQVDGLDVYWNHSVLTYNTPLVLRGAGQSGQQNSYRNVNLNLANKGEQSNMTNLDDVNGSLLSIAGNSNKSNEPNCVCENISIREIGPPVTNVTNSMVHIGSGVSVKGLHLGYGGSATATYHSIFIYVDGGSQLRELSFSNWNNCRMDTGGGTWIQLTNNGDSNPTILEDVLFPDSWGPELDNFAMVYINHDHSLVRNVRAYVPSYGTLDGSFIYISASHCRVSDNTMHYLGKYTATGFITSNGGQGDYNTISGNVVHVDDDASVNYIWLSSNSDYNVINGNVGQNDNAAGGIMANAGTACIVTDNIID